MNPKFTIIVMAAALLALGNPPKAQESTEIHSEELRYVGDVIGKSEYGDKVNDVSKKWKVAPKFALIESDDEQRAMVEKTIRHINASMPRDMKITWAESEDKANIKMHFAPSTKFAELGKKYGIKPKISNGYFHVWWDGNYNIYKSIVFIATDRLDGQPIQLKHCILEEIVQVLGPIGDTEHFPHSVFYEDKNKKVYGTATHLSELDKKLLRFLYNHVPAGSEQTEIGYLMSKHW